jgi:protein O-mannosyl-transferase
VQLHGPKKHALVFPCLLLAAATLLSYWPVLHCGFVNYDDPQYLTDNWQVARGLSWASIQWAFTTGAAANWHPVTWLSHMLDVQVFGYRAGVHHLVSLLFHIANTLILFLVLRKLTGALWRSAVVAGLFALHPLHVESVAWLSERKDILSTFFGLLAIWAYARYADGSEVQSLKSEVRSISTLPRARRSALHASRFTLHASRFYLLSLVCFTLSLMSKPMLVTLPFLLLLLDYWPLRRFGIKNQKSRPHALRVLLWEKVPFLLLGTACSVVTMRVQTFGGAFALELSLGERVANALCSYVRYAAKMFWPSKLSVLYPHPGHWLAWQVAGAGALLMAISLGAILLARRRPYFLVGWLWFVGTLVPVIGLIQVGNQSIADRYTYVPLVGLFMALVWGVSEVVPPIVCGALAIAVLGACAVLTARQVEYWHSGETLFRHAVGVTANNYVAYNNLGLGLEAQGQVEEAILNYRNALEINPRSHDALNDLGNALAGQQKYAEAIACLESALRLQPQFAEAHNNLGVALAKAGKPQEAIKQYQAALQLRPDYPEAHNNLGLTLAARGEPSEAIEQYKAALRFHPNYGQALNNLAGVLAQVGRLDEAVAQYRLVLGAEPGNIAARNNLGILLSMQGKLGEAVEQFQTVLRADPNQAGTHGNLAYALAAQHKRPEAVEHYRAVLTMDPDDARAHQGLANALADSGKLDEAVQQFTEALRLSPENPTLHYQFGLALARQGRHEQAAAQFREALRLKSDYPEARRQLEGLSAPPKP